MCAPWCGRGCTKTEHDVALRVAQQTAHALGKGWTPQVNHNMGWYPYVVSECGRVKVHPDVYGGRIRGYTAFLGEPGPGGRWAEHGLTARAAAQRVMDVAQADLRRIGALVTALPVFDNRKGSRAR